MTAQDAYFTRDPNGYAPLDPARGWWNRDTLHGRAVVGLMGHHIDATHGSAAHVPARLTVDMYRLAAFDVAAIHTRIVHETRRLRLVEAELVVAGRTCALATLQFLAAGESPPGQVWSPPAWDAPHPDALGGPVRIDPRRLAETRNVRGKMGALEPKQAWTRETNTLLKDEPLSAFDRMALSADFVSAYVHGADTGIEYMNTDVSLQLARLPKGEWIGYEATGHDASGGIAVGHCRLYDVDGPIGHVACTALANRRRV